MNIRQLRLFCLTARDGTFSAAAKAEGITIQAVSKSIHELEDELGAPLFERSGRGMRLTPLGETLIEPARDAVQSFELVEQAVAVQLKGPRTRDDLRLVLVTPPFSKHEFICGVLSRLMAHALGINTQLTVSVGGKALAGLMTGNIDALFTIGHLSAPRCVCTRIGSVAPGVFLGRNHPLRGKRALGFADLEPYPVLWSKEIDEFNDTVLVTCQKAGLRSTTESVENNEEVVDFLENRNGFIMGVNLKALSIRPFAMMHDLDPADAPSVPVCLVTLEDSNRPEVERLKQFVCNEFSLLRKLLNSEGTVTGY